MNPSAPELLNAIAGALERDLLPNFESSSWPASRIRSCLTLLTFLESRVATEGPILFADNMALRNLLSDAARSQGTDGDLIAEIDAVLARHELRDPYPPVATLAAANDAYRVVLEKLAARSIAHRRATKAPRTQLDDRIRAYLLSANERDFAAMAKSSLMPPF